MANPYLFIVGCPRSGTTLLQRMVNAHPQLAIIPESHWILRLFDERKGLTPEALVTPEVISCLLEQVDFRRCRVDQSELETLLESDQPVSYADFVTDIFDAYGRAQGKTIAGNKTPGFARRLSVLHALWPRARFVHLIRDGRDVCLSVADWPKAQQKKPGIFCTWREDPVSTTAFWWELNVRLARQGGDLLGPELYHEVRYESLIDNPAQECGALCRFLALPYDDRMLRFHEGRTRTKPGLDAKHAWLPITCGLRDWASQIPAADVERFEAAAGGLLTELGYPRGVSHPRREALEHASKIRDLLAQDPNWGLMAPGPEVERLELVLKARDSRPRPLAAAAG